MRFTAGSIWLRGIRVFCRRAERCHVIPEPCFQGEESGFTASGSRTDPSGDGSAFRMIPLLLSSEREGPGFTAFRIRPRSFGRWNSPQDDKTPGCRYRWAVLVCRPEQGEGPGHCHSEQSEGSGFKAPGITTRFFVASLLRMTGFGCHPEQREGPGFRPQDDREMWFFSIAGETLP